MLTDLGINRFTFLVSSCRLAEDSRAFPEHKRSCSDSSSYLLCFCFFYFCRLRINGLPLLGIAAHCRLGLRINGLPLLGMAAHCRLELESLFFVLSVEISKVLILLAASNVRDEMYCKIFNNFREKKSIFEQPIQSISKLKWFWPCGLISLHLKREPSSLLE